METKAILALNMVADAAPSPSVAPSLLAVAPNPVGCLAAVVRVVSPLVAAIRVVPVSAIIRYCLPITTRLLIAVTLRASSIVGKLAINAAERLWSLLV